MDYLLIENKSQSSIQLDGTHTIAKRGGEAVGYQGRKKAKTSNMLYITDAQGIPIACSEAREGRHNDAFELLKHMKDIFNNMNKCKIDTEGLADAGFDTSEFRKYSQSIEIIDNIESNNRISHKKEVFFDKLLYNQRFVKERTNARINGFKAVLIQFETNKTH